MSVKVRERNTKGGRVYKIKGMEDIIVVSNEKIHTKNLRDCPVSNVTVFVDRAEVNRIVETRLKHGKAEMLLTDLPECADPESLRLALC